MKKKLPSILKKIQQYVPYEIDYSKEKSISYSQFSMFTNCNYNWYLEYVENRRQRTASIHTLFGTALHETIQTWLDKLYTGTVKEAMEMDLEGLLKIRMQEVFKQEQEKLLEEHKKFTTASEMREFYEDGINILDFLKKKRSQLFVKKKVHLAGIEFPIVYQLKPTLYFKGYIDLLFYDEDLNQFTIIDIKTSTKGWNSYAKKDDLKKAQLLLYKYFLHKMFEIELDNIEVEFWILRRKIDDSLEFPPKRLQVFRPAAGKVKMNQALTLLNSFIEKGFDEEGKYVQHKLSPNPSIYTCRFCLYNSDKVLCPKGISPT